MKKMLLLVMAIAIIAVSFVACGTKQAASTAAATTAAATKAAATTAAATQAPATQAAATTAAATTAAATSAAATTSAALPDPSTIKGEIAIMVPSADHGWTGAVLHAAEVKKDELTKAGYKSVNVYAATDEASQIQQVEDLIAKGKDAVAGIAILPYDNGLQATLEKVSAAGIPFTQFDRLIDSDAMTTCVAKVVTDNVKIGYKSAEKFAADGMTTDSIVYILSGDTSSAASSRTEGFKKYLKDNGWTDDQIKKVTESPSTGWDPAEAKTQFTNWVDSTNFKDGTGVYVYCHDDGFVAGVLEVLSSGAVDSAKLDILKKNFKAICGCSYPSDLQKIMSGTHETAKAPDGCDVFSVTYDPTKIQEAVNFLLEYLGGAKFDVDQTIDPTVITKENMSQFTPFDTWETESK